MTTMSLVRGISTCAWCAAIAGGFAVTSTALSQTAGGSRATYPTNPRGAAAPVRQVSGPATPQAQQPYGPQPATPIKEPGAGGAPVERQMPLPIRAAVPAQGGVQPIPGAQPTGLKAPSWFPLPEDHAKYLDEILMYWEQKSDTVERYQCQFKRWEYDPVFGPRPGPDGVDVPKSYSEGQLHYKKPDKGNFHVKLSKVYVAPKAEGEKATYEKQADEMNEHWVCDGMSIFEFDGRKKQLIERPLPPEMQGKSIADGPLPFLFGAKAATIKQRYWMRVITPPNAKNEYWLEAQPKSRHDAANFKLVQVIIDEKDFLPKKLTVFAPNYDPRTNPAKTAYVFDDRQVNWNETLAWLAKPFERAFDKPVAPFGWTKVVEKPEIVSEAPPVDVRPLAPAGGQVNRSNAYGGAGKQAARPQNSRSVK